LDEDVHRIKKIDTSWFSARHQRSWHYG